GLYAPSQHRRPSGLRGRANRDLLAILAVALEGHHAGDRGEDCVVPTHPHTDARVNLGAELTDDDVAGDHRLATEDLDSTPLAFGVATVPRRALAFLMCHFSTPTMGRNSGRNLGDLDRRVLLAVPADALPAFLL